MLTEAEAREKGCPLVIRPNGSAEAQQHTRCIASDCMAWRWHQEPLPEKVVRTVGGGGPDPLAPTKGYCGAFGAA